MKAIAFGLAIFALLSLPMFAQVPPPENLDPCYGDCDGDGGGSLGCQYCYKTTYAQYANCYSSAIDIGDQRYANCRGTKMCWRDAEYNQYCEPYCEGGLCLRA
jgi:hypothetical protein